MLLTHYRSRFPRAPAGLRVVEELPIQQEGRTDKVDIAIVHDGEVVAVYELLPPEPGFAPFLSLVRRIRAFARTRRTNIEVGVVVPESREPDALRLKDELKGALQIVTYPG